jgi:CRISPR-associated exonuclease Cas4
MYTEDDLLPISALQHLAFCPRQCALIHIEQVWAENRLTAQGRLMHERVHEGGNETRGDVKTARGVRLRSLALGLAGIADVVEFHRRPSAGPAVAWIPFPVEYKRGKPKPDDCDKLQLCAQALCLEEMMGTDVLEGALFYGVTRRRLDVPFDETLRQQTAASAEALHQLVDSGATPPPQHEEKCRNCSLLEQCMPALSRRKSAAGYLDRVLSDTGGANAQ